MDQAKYRHKTPAAAAEFGISAATFRTLARKDPQFPRPLILGPRSTMWDLDALRAYFAAKREA